MPRERRHRIMQRRVLNAGHEFARRLRRLLGKSFSAQRPDHARVPDAGRGLRRLHRIARHPVPVRRPPDARRVRQQHAQHHRQQRAHRPRARPALGLAMHAARLRQQVLIVAAEPGACLVAHGAPVRHCRDGERALVQEVVVDHPLPPELARRVQVKQEAVHAPDDQVRIRRRRIEADPRVARNVRLHPGVRVASAHDVAAGQVVVFAAAEAVHDPRRDSQRAQHHRHGRREILAVSFLAFEQEIRQRVRRRRSRHLQAVAVMGAQVELDRRRLLVIRSRTRRDLLRQFHHPPVHPRRELEVDHGDVVRNLAGRPAQPFRARLSPQRRRGVALRHAAAVQVVHRAAVIHADFHDPALHADRHRRQKQHVGPDRLHQDFVEQGPQRAHIVAVLRQVAHTGLGPRQVIAPHAASGGLPGRCAGWTRMPPSCSTPGSTTACRRTAPAPRRATSGRRRRRGRPRSRCA